MKKTNKLIAKTQAIEKKPKKFGVNLFIFADFSESSNLIIAFPFAASKEEEELW